MPHDDASQPDQADENRGEKYGDEVRYEVLNHQSYPDWDDHTHIEDDIYVGPYRGEIPVFESGDIIRVIDPDYDTGEIQSYDFPPEVIQTGSILKLLLPTPDGRGVQTWGFDEWECQRCGAITETKPLTVDGEIEDCEPHECISCERQGPFTPPQIGETHSISSLLDSVPSRPMWEAPPGAGEPEMDSLFDDVRDHIETHWDGDEWMYDGLAAYVISTWVREELDFVPHLLVHGTHESGKTRLLNTMREVSYRCIHTAAPTAASIFRSIDSYNVTMYVSEYHDLPDEVQQQVDAVLKAGQKRGEVAMRATDSGGGYEPEVYDPFTHVAISTQFSVDDDMKSRCFEVHTSKTNKAMPRTVADCEDLRRRLLGFRSKYLNSDMAERASASTDEKMDEDGLFNRVGEKLHPILLVAELFNKDINEFVEHVVSRDEESASDTEEAAFTRALIDTAYDTVGGGGDGVNEDWSNVELKQTFVRDTFNSIEDRDVSSRYMTEIRDRVGLNASKYRDGVYIHHPNLKEKLKSMAASHNLDWEAREYGPRAMGTVEKPRPDSSPPDHGEADGAGRITNNTGGEEHAFVRAILDTIREKSPTSPNPLDADLSGIDIRQSEVRDRFNELGDGEATDRLITDIRNRLGLDSARSDGDVCIHHDDLTQKLHSLANRYGVDPEAGDTGVDQSNRVELTIDAVRTLDNANDGGATETAVIGALVNAGVDPEDAKHTIHKLLEDGTLYRTSDDDIALSSG